MNNKERDMLIENANNLYCLIQEHYHDISDIDYMIEELKHKRNTYEKRLVRDCNKLSNLLNSKDITKELTPDFIEDLNEAILFVNDLSKIE